MYSVEDLLISHGYKPSRDLSGPRKDNPEGCQQTGTRPQAGHGLLNGYEDDPTAFAHNCTSLGKGLVSDSESSRSTPRGHGERQSASASKTAEAGFYSQPTLPWFSQPQIRTDHTHRRRGQEVTSLLGLRDREDVEVRGMAQAHSLPVHMREGPWEVGGRTEHVMKKAVWEEELRMSGPAKWHNVNLESWNQSRKLGRQMSEGDGKRLFQDLYPFVQGENLLISQNKKKSRSLPRVLSPESLACMEIPIPLNDGHLPGVAKMPLYPPNCAPYVEATRNPEKAAFPRPKFGRPVKPPSYGSHHPSRGGENSDFQDSQHTDRQGSYLTKSNDSRHERVVSDSGLEPPVYVPPPSYRSPPQHIPNPYLEDPVPRHVSGNHSQQQHLTEEVESGCPLPSGPVGTGNEYSASLRSPQGAPRYSHPITAYEGSVQYIPFDDPRIRHIKLAQPPGFCEETKHDDRPYNSSPVTAQESAHGKMRLDDALRHPQGLIPTSGAEQGLASADSSPRWLWSQLPTDGENGVFLDQRDHCVMRGPQADRRGDQHGHAGGQAPSPHPQGQSTCESQTKLRKFETGIQTKKSSKKKVNETIFCLVSIPVKSEAHLPGIDRNNNDLKPSGARKPGLDKGIALQEQSLLSMSSTDLELQALTGNMAFPKQDLGEPEEDKQTNDLRFTHLAKHRELKYSGSWPGHLYRDQQTQTSFPEESKSPQHLPAAKPEGPRNVALTPKCLDPTASEAPLHPTLADSDQTQKPEAPNLRGQMSLSPSSNSAFSRTSSSRNQASVPKAGSGQPCLDGDHSPPKPEVVKGEPTAGPCNSKQLFGQFLLKPVSRRPWDLISQLESFNKELQEEEESHNSSSSSSSEDSETDQQPEDWADCRPRPRGYHESSQERRTEQQPRVSAPEDPGFQVGRVKSKSESWSEEPKPCQHDGPLSPGASQVKDSRGDPFQWVTESVMAEQQQRKQEVVNGMYELVVSPGPVKRTMATKPATPSSLAEPREPLESWEFTELTEALGSVPLSRVVPLEVDSGEEMGTVVALSLTNKTRGLSAPDLRSVGLTTGHKQDVTELEEALGGRNAMEIPPSESLQARAERILGIEVAVESLLPGAKKAGQSQLPEPDANACSPESLMEQSLPSPEPSGIPPVTTDAFYSRRKCGWTQSPLFVGERAPQTSEPSDVDRVPAKQATSPEPQPRPREARSFEEKDVGAKPPFRSTLFHFIERTSSVAGSEKRFRSPSKVIESLQERLASPPRRADSDRVMRMKEVNSVSRMRCLSSRNTDSKEEGEDRKAVRGQAWPPGGPVSLSSGDPPWRVGHSPSISKGFTSREENGHPAAQREKNWDPDFWCPDSYDPSRVERV